VSGALVPGKPRQQMTAAVQTMAVALDLRTGGRWIRGTTTASVVLLACIAAVVSYGHMHMLTLVHGESAWTAALIPLSVDGMIVASSMTLLADSRAGRAGGVLPWVLLAAGSAASLAANVAAAEPTVYGRIIAAWPSFALIGAYELLMRQIRSQATAPDHAAPCAATAAWPRLRAITRARHTVQFSARGVCRPPGWPLPRSSSVIRRCLAGAHRTPN
jgi:Protein of unknown function (DUF2637)